VGSIPTAPTNPFSERHHAHHPELATALAWDIKERTMRRQFEELVRRVKSGQASATQFAPIVKEDVDAVYDGMIAAGMFLALKF
jgi:hypothetical protein